MAVKCWSPDWGQKNWLSVVSTIGFCMFSLNNKFDKKKNTSSVWMMFVIIQSWDKFVTRWIDSVCYIFIFPIALLSNMQFGIINAQWLVWNLKRWNPINCNKNLNYQHLMLTRSLTFSPLINSKHVTNLSLLLLLILFVGVNM